MNYFELLPRDILLKDLYRYLDNLDLCLLKRTCSTLGKLFLLKNVPKQEKQRKKRMCKLRKFNPSLYIMEKYPEKLKNWSWDTFSDNLNFTIDIYKKYPNKKWNLFRISRHPNITWEIIKENNNIPWNWKGVTCNPNITMEIIKNNPNEPWNYFALGSNPNITEEMLKKYINCIDIEELIATNPIVTIQIIEKYKDKIFWPNIAQNNLGTK